MQNNQVTSENPLRLLIVDDDPGDLELCVRELRRSGVPFVAATATTREGFLEELLSGSFDVVVSDYRMKTWTGMDALALVKQFSPDVPVILQTGTLGDERAVDCIKQGVTDYVLKEQLARLPMVLLRAREERHLRIAEMKALEALREGEARYRGLVQHLTFGILWADTPSGKLLDVNPALVKMLGYDSSEELLSVGFTGKLYSDPAQRDDLLAQYLQSGHATATAEWKRKDGQVITVKIVGRKTAGPDGRSECAEVMVEDITERKSLERQLVQAQKFEAIGQLAGGIAHDFNNMIGAMMGWADLGLEETELGTRLHRHFQKVRQQAERAAALTRQLLAFARRQILEPRDIDLNQSVIETVSLLETVIGSNIAIKAHLDPNLSIMRADATQLEQVLMNLCINARDAMPDGGSLVIETSNVSLDAAFCKLQPHATPGEYVVLSVSDTGIGMDAATLDRIFEPFFTTKELGKGTGLGLATVYGIVRQHCGFLHVYSEPAAGTTFRAYFPVSASTNSTRPEKAEDAGQVRGGGETILFVEDHEDLRLVTAAALTSLGYHVVTAVDGEDAFAKFQEQPAAFDLALLDVMLPKCSGPEAYERIRQIRPDLPAVFATGYSPDLSILQKVQQAGWPILQKPYVSRVLGRVVRETLDQRAPALRRD